jgi:internalin A
LVLDNNQISDISPLSELRNLGELHLENNQISDIRPLAGLEKLFSLYIMEGNNITDWSPVAHVSFIEGLP